MKNLKKILFIGFLYIAGSSVSLFSAEVTKAQEDMLKNLPADQRDSILLKMERANELQEELDEVFEEESTMIEKPEREITGIFFVLQYLAASIIFLDIPLELINMTISLSSE